MAKAYRVLILLPLLALAGDAAAGARPAMLAHQLFLFDISEEQEIEIGKAAARQVEKENRLLRNQAVNGYVQALGERLARNSGRSNLSYHFKVIDRRDANAFALPGGYIYLHRGIIELAKNEGELAGVLAHEIAHVTERHGVEQAKKAQRIGLGLSLLDLILGGSRGSAESLAALGANLFAQGVFFKYSRDAEREADRVGVDILRRSGMNPRGMVTLFERMESLRKSRPKLVGGFFSSHPSLKERQENVSGVLVPSDSKLRTDSRDFQRAKGRL